MFTTNDTHTRITIMNGMDEVQTTAIFQVQGLFCFTINVIAAPA